MKKMLTWLYMLNKRLYKRGSYVVILLLIFAWVLGFAAVSRRDSGFVHIALAQVPGGDGVGASLIETLLQEDSIIRFTYMASPEEGIEAVKTGQADGVWIFPPSFTEETGNAPAVVRVVEREQTVFLRLAREKLYGLLYNQSAKALFLEYGREKLPMLDSLSDEELLSYFENCKIGDELFVSEHPVSPSAGGVSSQYLTAPLRGLLGILCVLGGLAGVLYNLQDEERNIFSNIPHGKRPLLAMATVLVSALNVGILSLPALWLSGLSSFEVGEILNTLVLVGCTLCFSMVVREIFTGVKSFGAVIPTLLTAMCILCPVFFSLKEGKWLSYLFPPTYYIHGSYDRSYLLYGAVYGILCLVATQVLRLLKKAKASYL